MKKKPIEFLSLIVAIAALFLSFRACSDSNEALKISKQQSMAFLQVVDAQLEEPIRDASCVKIKLNIKNLGQIPANNVKAEFDYGVFIGSIKSDGNIATRSVVGGIGQGFEKSITLKSNHWNHNDWKIKNGRFQDVIYFYGTIFYKDDLSEEEKKVDWCFELPLNNENALTALRLYQSDGDEYESTYKQKSQ
jgi:hypothetical protein